MCWERVRAQVACMAGAASVTGRVRIIAAVRIGGIYCRRTQRCSTVSSPIPGAASDVGMVPDADSADPADTDSPRTIKAAAEAPGSEATGVEAAHATSVEAAEAAAKPVDEERGRSVAAGQITFEHIDIKGQSVALELRCLQHHDG